MVTLQYEANTKNEVTMITTAMCWLNYINMHTFDWFPSDHGCHSPTQNPRWSVVLGHHIVLQGGLIVQLASPLIASFLKASIKSV